MPIFASAWITFGIKYFPLALPYFKPFYYEDRNYMILEFRQGLAVSDDLHQLLSHDAAISFLSMGAYLVDRKVLDALEPSILEFPFPAPEDEDFYSDLGDTEVIFNSEYTRLKFPKSLRSLPLALANSVGLIAAA